MLVRTMKLWVPVAICLVALMPGCGDSGTENAAPGNAAPGKATGGNEAAKSEGAAFDAEKVPSQDQILTLTKTTLTDFNEGVQAKNFDKFYKTISQAWQKQTTPEDLAKSFKPITDQNEKGTNIAPALKNMKPVFSPDPAITDSLLVVKGYYPTTPSRTTFTLKYIAEDNAWKLAGINLKFEDAPKEEKKEEKKEESKEEPKEEKKAE